MPLPKIVQRPVGGVLVKKGYRPRALSATIGTARALGYLLRGVQALLIDGGQATYSYPNAVLSDNPVLYYRLNEGIGTTITDFTGNGYDGTLSTGVTERQPGYSASDSNTSMLLTGSASISIPFNLLKPYTWTSLSLEYLVSITSGWQHIVTTIDASGHILHYLNGRIYNHLPPYLPRALSATLVNPPISSDPILVDLDLFYSGSYMAGDLDEVALYNYVLSPTQIATHYNASIVPAPLSATLAGVGTLAGTFSLATALTTTLAGVGTLNGTLSANTALSDTLVGVGTLNGTLSLTTALTDTLTGVFSLRTALSLAFAGAGTLIPNLGVRGLTIQFLTATWVTRDLQATWTTRDEQAAWDARDNLATWKAR